MEEAREKLKQRFANLRTGGKGSVRRKKVKSGRLIAQEEASEAFKKNLAKIVNTLNAEMKSIAELEFQEYAEYTNIFVKKFTNNLGKQSRRSNRGDRPVTIRTQISQYLQIDDGKRCYDTELVEYTTQQVNQDTLENLLELFNLLIEIIQREEYRYFINPETKTLEEKKAEDNDSDPNDTSETTVTPSTQKVNDSMLIKAYQRLKIDYSQQLTPLSLRQQYLQIIKTEERREKLSKYRQSYFVILRLLPIGNK